MGTDILCCLEAKQVDRWVFLCDFEISRNVVLFERLGFRVENDAAIGTNVSDWSAMTRLLHKEWGGLQRGVVSLDVFRATVEECLHGHPGTLDLRPGGSSKFRVWADAELRQPDWLAWFMKDAPSELTREVGSEFRVCYWFS